MLIFNKLPPHTHNWVGHLHRGIDTELSPLITRLRFPAAVGVVLIHVRLATQLSTSTAAQLYWLFLEMLSRAAVPFFFIASSYLYFAAPAKPYGLMLRGKVRRLFVPMVLWTLISLALFALGSQSDPRPFSGLYALIEQHGWLSLFKPDAVNGSLWFLQWLMAFFLCAPLLEWLFCRIPWWLVLPALLLWRCSTLLSGWDMTCFCVAALHVYVGFLLARFSAHSFLVWLKARPAILLFGLLAMLVAVVTFFPFVCECRIGGYLDLGMVVAKVGQLLALLSALKLAMLPSLPLSERTRSLAAVSMFVYCAHQSGFFTQRVAGCLVTSLPVDLPVRGDCACLLAVAIVTISLALLGLLLRRYLSEVYALLTGEMAKR